MKAKQIILVLLTAMAAGVGTGLGATNEVSGLLQKGLFEEEANHNLDAAIQAYRAVVTQTDKDHQFAATAIFRLGECYRKQGKTNEANAEYQRIVREFPDQTELVTLSRQQLGSAGEQAQSNAASAGQIAEIKKLGVGERRVVVQQMFPNPVLNALMQKMNEAEQDLAALKVNFGDQYPDVQAKVAQLKSIYRQIDDQVEAVLAGGANGSGPVRDDAEKSTSGTQAVFEANEIKQLQAMLRDSPDLLNSSRGGGLTRLHDAAQMGQLAVAKFLLDNGADVNARDHSQLTPLHDAVRTGRKEMAELLLSRGAKVDAQDKEGKTPLHLTAESGFKAVAELLLAHGAAVDAKNSSGETAGETALHEAAHAGNGAIAELLLANKADVNARDVNGGTPLYIAAEMGHPAVIELLLAHGADINATRLGVTPLMKAIAQNNTDAAKALLQHGADIKIQVPQDSPALASWAGWAALQFAVDKNNVELVKLLLQKGADVNLKVQHGKTPLIAAVEGKEVEITKLLLEHGANVNSRMEGNHPSVPRGTALEAAVWLKDNELVKLLLEHQADPNLTYDLANSGNVYQRNTTPLMLAVQLQEKEIVRTLLASKADVNLTNSTGGTALLFAFDNKNLEIAALLLENKADTESRNNYGARETILQLAVERGKKELAELLLAHGADVNSRNSTGETPLHLAAGGGSPEIVELLLAHGADTNAKDDDGNTPLDRVQSRPDVPTSIIREIRSLLREHGGVAAVDIATIRVMRNGKLMPKIIFRKDRGSYNRFTLFELVANMYGEAKTGIDPKYGFLAYLPEAGLEFPDFSRLKVIHLAENGRTNVEAVDAQKALTEGECSRNIALKWGDILEVAETDHKVAEIYGGLSQHERETLSKCLVREVEIMVKGQTTRVRLAPDLSDARAGGHVSAQSGGNYPSGMGREMYLLHSPGSAPVQAAKLTQYSFWLSEVVHGANVVLASSDLTRVKVRRAGKEMVFNLEKIEANSDLWLEDGDVIKIPEKAGE